MIDRRWAPLVRLQEKYRVATAQSERDLLDLAISREVAAIAEGRGETGSLATLRANHRLLDRNRARLERRFTPLMAAANDPWPELDRRMTRERTVNALSPATRRTLELLMSGLTYAEAGAACDTPVGTLKARVSRAVRRMAS